MIRTNYNGCLIAAHPKRKDSVLSRSVVLIVDHDQQGTIGHRIDTKFNNDLDLQGVMGNLGIIYTGDEPLYKGGSENSNRLVIIHTLDYTSKSTIKLAPDLGISYDISILNAIAKGRGPRKFRALAGYQRWLAGFLEGEIMGHSPWHIEHSWSVVEPTEELIFDLDEKDQWLAVINHSTNTEVNSWFSHVQD